MTVSNTHGKHISPISDYGTVPSHAYCLGCFDVSLMGDMLNIL